MHILAIEPAIEDLTRGLLNNESQWIQVAIKKLSRRQKVSRWIELAIESYRECDKKKLKGSLSVESYRETIEIT